MTILDIVYGMLTGFKTLDVQKAVQICKMNAYQTVHACILEDFNGTADVIFQNGKIVVGSTPHISSNWGTPGLYLEELNQFIPCWKYGFANWRNQ